MINTAIPLVRLIQNIKTYQYRRKIKKAVQYITRKACQQHMYVTWKTWSGKSSLIEQWIYWHRRQTRKTNACNIILIDPHGDTSETIRRFDLAKDYQERFVFIDPLFSKGMTPCLNPLQLNDKSDSWKELYTQQLVSVFEDIIPDVLSTYMKALLTPCIATLLHVWSTDLTHLQQFMSPKHCERRVELGKQSPIRHHRKFFKEEFDNPIYLRTKGSIYTKLQSLLNSTVFTNMTMGESTIVLQQELRKGRVIVFKLSKGLIGEAISITLGKLIIAQLKQIALRNASLPEQLRIPTYLIIDEADTYVSWSWNLITILKETRKFGLHLCMLSQNIIGWRWNTELQRNVLSNTNVKIIGKNSIVNLKPLAKEIGLKPTNLLFLQNYEFVMNIGDDPLRTIKTQNVFHTHSPLLSKKWELVQEHLFQAKHSGYYKPIIPLDPPFEDWIGSIPKDFQTEEYNTLSPKPKFTF